MTDTGNLNSSLGISEFGQLNERGKSVIKNIRDLQKTEEGLFRQLQTGASTQALNASQQQELVNQIKNVSQEKKVKFELIALASPIFPFSFLILL